MGEQASEETAAKKAAGGNQPGPGSLGPEGTIPDSKDGIGSTVSDEPSEFEPEENSNSAGTEPDK